MATSLPDDDQVGPGSLMGHVCVYSRIIALLFGVTLTFTLVSFASILSLPSDEADYWAAVMVAALNIPVVVVALALLIVCRRQLRT